MTTTCRSDPSPIAEPRGTSRGVSFLELSFASCYVYSPNGTGSESERSRVLRELLKAGDARFLSYYADRVRRELGANASLAGFLCPGSVLVPVPGSEPTGADEHLVAVRLARALIAQGLGKSLWRGLRRVWRVRKSATAPPGSRPTVADHYESFDVERGVTPPAQIVLVDDVVTKGRTLLAAAARLHEIFPTSDIRAFALLRTMGLGQKVDRLLVPCVGKIKWRAGDAYRDP